MKNYCVKTLLFLVFFLVQTTVIAQSENAVQLNTYELDSTTNIVRVSIKTTESFIVGANRYVLHIGGKHFLRSEHPEGRLDEIVFYVPFSEYETLTDQGRIVLVYGFYHDNTEQDDEGSQVSGFTGKHWVLGKFTSQNLTNK